MVKSKFLLFLLFCLVIFLGIWIAISHVTKKKLIKILSSMNDDNIQIFYKDVQISGFPKKFIISLKKPVIKIINSHQIKSISLEKIDINFDLLMREPYLDFGQEFYIQRHSGDMILQFEQKIKSLEPNIITFELEDSLLKMGSSGKDLSSNFIQNFKSLSFKAKNFEIFLANKLESKIENFIFYISKISFQENDAVFNLKFISNYRNMKKKDSTKLEFDLNFTRYFAISEEERSRFKEISANQFSVKTENASLDLRGSLSLFVQKHAVGTLNINLKNYHELISILIDGGIRSEAFFSKIFTEASKSENDSIDLEKNAKFSIKFEEDNIYFGNIEMNQLIRDALKNE